MVLYQSTILVLVITMVRFLYIVRRAEGTHTEPRAIIIASYGRFAVRPFLRHRDDFQLDCIQRPLTAVYITCRSQMLIRKRA
jgi:hypothetical protein